MAVRIRKRIGGARMYYSCQERFLSTNGHFCAYTYNRSSGPKLKCQATEMSWLERPRDEEEDVGRG